MIDQWNEVLRCPQCKSSGLVNLSQPNDSDMPSVDSISDGFKAEQTEYGPGFLCGVCNVPAMP
jgi:hypothetical protein